MNRFPWPTGFLWKGFLWFTVTIGTFAAEVASPGQKAAVVVGAFAERPARELFGLTNLWTIHLNVTATDW